MEAAPDPQSDAGMANHGGIPTPDATDPPADLALIVGSKEAGPTNNTKDDVGNGDELW